ncbi:hypothetical protein D3C86_2172300 [compost metagenome]
MLSQPVVCEPTKDGVWAKGTGYSWGMWPSFLVLLMNAFKSSPITSAMQVVETAIMSGL